MRTFAITLAAIIAIALAAVPAAPQLGSDVPSDAQLVLQRATEAGCTSPTSCPSGPEHVFNAGIFDIGAPPAGTMFTPATRVPREQFGVVGPFLLNNGLTAQDLNNLVFPDATPSEKAQLVEGLQFFTMFHTAAQGLGPLNNQPACIGCHLNAAEAVQSKGLLQGQGCLAGSARCTNVSNVTRAGRATPTNFAFTSLDPATGGGRPPDHLDALFNTGKTAAFTTFGDFAPNHADAASNPTGLGFYDPLDGLTANLVTGQTSPPFGGLVQHVRPAVDACLPKPLSPVEFDANLNGALGLPMVFRRSVGERAGPPYIGRGLMEAVPTGAILANAVNAPNPEPRRANGPLGTFPDFTCSATGCIAGTANMIPRTFAVNANGTVTGFVGGVGRFGLRANGVEIMQFVVGGLQGELSFTSLLNPTEITFPSLFPGRTTAATEPLQCALALSETGGQPPSVLPPPLTPGPVDLAQLEVHLSTPFSVRNFLRNTAPPEFGDALLRVLRLPEPTQPLPGASADAKVQRGAELFGIDLVAFAHRTVGGAMTAGGDGRDDQAIHQTDRKLNCVGCHTPIHKTGQSPAEVGPEHLSYVWAPIFSDLLLHHMPVIDAERVTSNGLPRAVIVIPRLSMNATAQNDDGSDRWGHGHRRVVDTFDLPRNLADDTFSNFKASAEGSEFRTPPLMGLGRIGPPFLHDGRVFLSRDTVHGTLPGTAPAGTVTTNRDVTNAPLVVRSLDEAILAAIELHDLPAPDDPRTPRTPGAGCPVPPEATNVSYGSSPQDVICPPYDSATSQTNRSDAREVMRRFRELSPEDQQAVIEFLKQL
jgi:hypothetical protein